MTKHITIDTLTARLLSIPAAEYHADPCEMPSLSSSLAQIIVAESPLHAWTAHPRLNPARVDRDSARRAEVGSVAHKLALGAGADVSVLGFDSYRSKAAQEARAEAETAGRIPVLAEDYLRAVALAKPLAEAAAEYMGAAIADCLTEQVIIWRDASGGWRRCMVDLMSRDYRRLCDLKTTQASVAPEACARRVYEGYHVQAAFYLRGADALDPAGAGLRRFGFVFAEQSEPFAVSPPIELSEAGLDMGRRAVDRACGQWDSCMASGVWPGYPRDVMVAEPPSWKVMQETAE